MTTAEWATAWTAALDDLELTLEETERLLSGEDLGTGTPEPWSPPQLASPLPPEMLERAQSLLTRQQHLISATAIAMSGTRQSLNLVGRVADGAAVRRPAQSVYLDVRA